MIGILSVCLISCSPSTSATIIPVTDTEAKNTARTPVSTKTLIPPTATKLLPVPTNTPILEPTTETPVPAETLTLTPALWPTSEAYFDGARVTFIDNAGFLITVGDKKILIDALYDTNNPRIDPPQEVLRRMVIAEPPFDQIDLVIATHSHNDHFSANLVREHFRNNEKVVFVSSSDAVRQINRSGDEFVERLVAIDLAQGESLHLSIHGIELDCLYLSHGIPAFLNIGMVITVGEYTFFHSGDMSTESATEEVVSLADLQGYGLPQKAIDLALLPVHIFLVEEGVILIEAGIRARYVTPMHYFHQYPPTNVEEKFSNAVVFKDTMETWVVPLE